MINTVHLPLGSTDYDSSLQLDQSPGSRPCFGAFPPLGSGVAAADSVAYSCGAAADSHRFPEHPATT